ncbi:hypothetical protein ES705_49428 [subsurface metagenome]
MSPAGRRYAAGSGWVVEKAVLPHIYITGESSLGNEIYYYFKDLRRFEEINYKVLKFFGIDKKIDFKSFIAKIEKATEKL